MFYRRFVPFFLLVALLTACSNTAPQDTPLPPTEIITNTPIPMPRTRTAPTLPPTFTATATPTTTATPTATLTPTMTPTLSPEDICAAVSIPAEQLEGITIDGATGVTLIFGGNIRGGILYWTETNLDTGTISDTSVPTDAGFIMAYGTQLESGSYELKASVTYGAYTGICEESARFTVIAPEATEEAVEGENSLLVDLLQVLIKHARRAAPTLTPSPESTPEATPEP